MNFFKTIKADVGNFFKTVETDAGKFFAAFVKIFKKAPAATQVVQNFVDEAAPIINLAAGLADPAIEPAVAEALKVAETGLAAVQAALTAANSGQSLLGNLQNFATTVPQLLGGIEVKNPQLKATIERIVTLVVSEAKVLIPAVEHWIGLGSPSTSTSGGAPTGTGA